MNEIRILFLLLLLAPLTVLAQKEKFYGRYENTPSFAGSDSFRINIVLSPGGFLLEYFAANSSNKIVKCRQVTGEWQLIKNTPGTGLVLQARLYSQGINNIAILHYTSGETAYVLLSATPQKFPLLYFSSDPSFDTSGHCSLLHWHDYR